MLKKTPFIPYFLPCLSLSLLSPGYLSWVIVCCAMRCVGTRAKDGETFDVGGFSLLKRGG
jgi:hypothetical protein